MRGRCSLWIRDQAGRSKWRRQSRKALLFQRDCDAIKCLENREEEKILAPFLQETLWNEAQHGMKTVSLPGQLNLQQGVKLFWLSHVTNQDVLCNVIIIKKNPTKRMLNNWKKACRAGLYFFQDLLPLVSKERGKKKQNKTRNQKESQVESQAVPEPGERPGRLAGSQAGQWWKPAWAAAEVHPNRCASAKYFAYDKSASSDKNLFCWKSPSTVYYGIALPPVINKTKVGVRWLMLMSQITYIFVNDSLCGINLKNLTSGISVWFCFHSEGRRLSFVILQLKQT